MISLADIGTLPPTLNGRQAAELFGCSYDCLLDQVATGTCPVAPLRLGRRFRWPTRPILDLLGMKDISHD